VSDLWREIEVILGVAAAAHYYSGNILKNQYKERVMR
jgi:hypothetical protein